MGLKPIFREERLFFKKQTGIELPTDCWRNGSKIYLDIYCDKPLYTFKVENSKIVIKKNNTDFFKNYHQFKLAEIREREGERIKSLEQDSIQYIKDMVLSRPNYYYLINHSGGKDSTVIFELWDMALDELKDEGFNIDSIDWNINFANTSNDTADTYRYIKNLKHRDKLKILNPQKGWSQWLKEDKNYFLPSRLVRNCCSTYKEGQVNKAYDRHRHTVDVLGVRWQESTKRKNYELIMDYDWAIDHFGSSTFSKEWLKFAPIIDWSDTDVWLWILINNIKYNKMYDYGFNRVGCLICPYQSDYIDMLIAEHYPKRWDWWINDILPKNYENTAVAKRLKWTLLEWQSGKWKNGTSKENDLISKKKTTERVKELANIKNISYEMAEKFFDNKVCSCGAKLNPTELGMFYKIYGRQENEIDNRTPLCKKCLCEELNIAPKEYAQKAIDFRNEGCDLF